MAKYRFTINGRQVLPLYSSEAAKKLARENGRRFFRASLTEPVRLSGPDFDWFDAQPFDTEFSLLIERSENGAPVIEWRGRAWKTDAELDYDAKVARIEFATVDEYTALMDMVDVEYNVPSLPVAKTGVKIRKGSVLQIYLQGTGAINNFLGAAAWQVDVGADATPVADMQNLHGFAFNGFIGLATVSSADPARDVAGGFSEDPGGVLYSYDDRYALTYREDAIDGTWYYELTEGATLLYLSAAQPLPAPQTPYTFSMAPVQPGETNTLSVTIDDVRYFSRYLSAAPEYRGASGVELVDDPFGASGYRYGVPAPAVAQRLSARRAFSPTPTELGASARGLYYTQQPPSVGTAYPVARSAWGDYAFWVDLTASDTLQPSGQVLRDAALVSDVIQAMLDAGGTGLTHAADTAHSEYLYGLVEFRLALTQITNVTTGDYTAPASKGLLKLSEVLEMLRLALNCHWFVEGGKLRIEHVSWFEGGGSYLPMPVDALDLTKLLAVRAAKPYAYGINRVSYDKPDMPEYIDRQWADRTRESFNGVPMRCLSGYVTKGQTEQATAARFNADINFMLSNPGDMSRDCFALMAAEFVNEVDLDAADVQLGYDLVPGGGTGVNPAYNVTGFIDVVPGTPYSITNAARLAWYDKNYNNTSTELSLPAVPGAITRTPGASAKYLRISALTANWPGLELRSESVYGVAYADNALTGAAEQNGKLAWPNLQERFLLHDAPCASLEVNGQPVAAASARRHKRQDVAYPCPTEPEPLRPVKTAVGIGEQREIEVNLSTRTAKATIYHDTEQ